MAPGRDADPRLSDARAVGPRRTGRGGVGRGYGYRSLRLHTDPAADDGTGGPDPGSRGTSRHRQLCRLPRGAVRWLAHPRAEWHDRVAWRASLVTLVATLAAMPLLPTQSDGLPSGRSPASPARWCSSSPSTGCWTTSASILPHLPGWGLGGVGIGIALSGALVLMLPATAGWRGAWWMASLSAGVLSVAAWAMSRTHRPRLPHPSRRRHGIGGSTHRFADSASRATHSRASDTSSRALSWSRPSNRTHRVGGQRSLAVRRGGRRTVGSAVGMAQCARWSAPGPARGRAALQAAGIALPALAGGSAAALVGAVLFGGTFIGVSTMALAAGRSAAVPRRRRLANRRVLRRSDPGPGGGDAAAAPRLPARTHRRRRGGRCRRSPRVAARRIRLSPRRHGEDRRRQPDVLSSTPRSDRSIARERVDDGDAPAALGLTASPHQRPRPHRRRIDHRPPYQVRRRRVVLALGVVQDRPAQAAGRGRRTSGR